MEKHLIIKNLGPLKEADVELGKLNIVIGTQSSGKSCLLKMACYCTWVEKRLILTQFYKLYEEDVQFINDFVEYYKMKGYVKKNTFISYSSPFVNFSYDNTREEFNYNISSSGWRYSRPKVTYVPSERNVVSIFPDFSSLPNMGTHIQDFMTDWNIARNANQKEENVLNLGLNYHYDKNNNLDIVETNDGHPLELTNTSSGVQSLLPLYVHLDFLTNGMYKDSNYNLTDLPLDKANGINKLLEFLYRRIVKNAKIKQNESSIVRVNNQTNKYWFKNEADKNKFEGYINRLLVTKRTEIFLEEPENNLFPPTQTRLLDWLLERVENWKRDDTLFIATHSPYILTELLEYNRKDLHFFFTYYKNEGMSIKTASQEDIQQIYDYGVDMFFNYESYL